MRRKEIAAGGKHLAEFNPHRPQLLQRQAQTFAKRLIFMAIGIQNSIRRQIRSGSVIRILGMSSSSP
jgi:hypothetical protein